MWSGFFKKKNSYWSPNTGNISTCALTCNFMTFTLNKIATHSSKLQWIRSNLFLAIHVRTILSSQELISSGLFPMPVYLKCAMLLWGMTSRGRAVVVWNVVSGLSLRHGAEGKSQSHSDGRLIRGTDEEILWQWMKRQDVLPPRIQDISEQLQNIEGGRVTEICTLAQMTWVGLGIRSCGVHIGS